MSTESDLLQTIQAAPGDAAPRLVYADWLSERGEPRGELIHLQCELAAHPTHPKRSEIVTRCRELIDAHQSRWLGVKLDPRIRWGFWRGFPVPCFGHTGVFIKGTSRTTRGLLRFFPAPLALSATLSRSSASLATLLEVHLPQWFHLEHPHLASGPYTVELREDGVHLAAELRLANQPQPIVYSGVLQKDRYEVDIHSQITDNRSHASYRLHDAERFDSRDELEEKAAALATAGRWLPVSATGLADKTAPD